MYFFPSFIHLFSPLIFLAPDSGGVVTHSSYSSRLALSRSINHSDQNLLSSRVQGLWESSVRTAIHMEYEGI
jgi:hypothetical protein